MESTVECPVTFGDLDPMGIVWHGNYFRFMEAGREAFGKAHDLDAMDMHAKGYFTPIVRSFIEHKAPLVYGDVVVVRTWMEPSPAAKIILKYELRHKVTGHIVAIGETMQVFLDKERKLVLDLPDFYRAWKAAHNS